MEIRSQFKEKCSRGDLLRLFWIIPVGIILYFWGIVGGILFLVHFVMVLVTQKRDRRIYDHLHWFLKYQWQWTMYMTLMDDVQPEWNPLEFMKGTK